MVMEKYYKNWNNFINEQGGPNTYPFTIYCDMDGVLVDLIEGIGREVNKQMPKDQYESFMKILTAGESWKDLKTSEEGKELLKRIHQTIGDDVDFWANLPPMQGAHQLWEFISAFDAHILSHPWDDDSAKRKRIWVSNLAGNLDPAPPQARVHLTGDKHKYAVNKETGGPNILIDDMDKYLGPWAEKGGIAIKHVSVAETIRHLEEIMREAKGNIDEPTET